MEEAQFLTKFASTVHWITNKDVEPSDEHAQDLLAEPNVKHWSHTRLMSIDGDASGVTGCHVQQRGDDTPQELPVDGVFIYVAGCAGDASRTPRSRHASSHSFSPRSSLPLAARSRSPVSPASTALPPAAALRGRV